MTKIGPANIVEVKHADGRYLARTDNLTALDGATPKRFVMIAFDSIDKANGFYQNTKEMTAMNRTATDPEGRARLAAFQQGLQQLGWSDGRNIQIDIRWGEDNIDRERKLAAELVALAPDVILASGTVSVTALQPISGTVPVVFAVVTDPVGAGFVDNLARPGGNLTGFMHHL